MEYLAKEKRQQRERERERERDFAKKTKTDRKLGVEKNEQHLSMLMSVDMVQWLHDVSDYKLETTTTTY